MMSSYNINYGPEGTTLIQAGGEYFLAYEDPTTGMILYWKLTMDALENITDAPEGLTFDNEGNLLTEVEGFQVYTADQWKSLEDNGQVWFAGQLAEIKDEDFVIENTVAGIESFVEDEPWGKRPDFINLVTELIIEDSDNWVANLQLDERFREILNDEGYTVAMYNNYRTYKGDKLGKDQLIKESIGTVKGYLLGLEADLDEDTINWVANKIASGAWSNGFALQQLTGATQKGSIYADTVESDFQNVLENGVITFSAKGEDEVKQLLDTWLPEELHAPYLADISNLAGQYINDPKFIEDFTEKLKDQRYAFNSNWDKEIPWQNIYNNAITLAEGIWGVVPEKGDVTISAILEEPELAKRKEMLRLEGLERGYVDVSTDLVKGLDTVMGDNVIPTQEYTSGRR